MELFYFVLTFLLLGSFIKKEWQNLFFWISFIVLFILAGFRDSSVGTDTLSYENIFLRISAGSETVQEIGWQVLNRIVAYFNGNFQDLLVITSLLILFPLFLVVRKHSLNPMLSIFLYYAFYIYLQSFNITRQSVAITIILIAYVYLINKRNWHFLILVLLAATFHTTALLCIPIVFVNRIPDKVPVYLILMITTIFIGLVFSNYILTQAATLLGYDNYLELYESGTSVGVYLIVLNLFFLFVLFASSERGVLFKLFFVFIVLANLTANVPYGYRIIFYFTIIQILYLPYFISNNKLGGKPLAFALVILYALVVFYRSAGSGGIVPYINILF